MTTPPDSLTGRSLAATRAVRLGLHQTRDVSTIEGVVEVLDAELSTTNLKHYPMFSTKKPYWITLTH